MMTGIRLAIFYVEYNRGGNYGQGTWILSSVLVDQIAVLPAFADWSTQNDID
jgi:hypothetical protein